MNRPPGAAPGPAAAAAALVLLLAPATPALAQAEAEAPRRPAGWLPFPPPLASPLEPHTRLAPVRVSRGDRRRWVGLVDLGDRVALPLAGAGEGGPVALAASVAGGVFSRFDLEGAGNELVEAHYRVGVRLRARLGRLEGRLELRHVSSHLGDEFLERTGRAPVSTSREGVELLIQGRPGPGLRVYGGPGLVVRSTEGLDAPSVRGGVEWRPRGPRWGAFVPYASAEAFAWEELGWDPTLASEAGVAFGGGHFRLALTAGTGPSRAEQFFREGAETLWGLSFSVVR